MKEKNEVTYLASIVPCKNFHLLAKVWKDVIASIPDAHLNVIGSGNLYNSQSTLGKWGIATKSYEDIFMPYLIDTNNNILPSVTFWGKLGNEKYDILKRTKVGVANPGGYETFCISALEMQMYGAKLVSLRQGGLIDTAYDQSLLYNNPKKLASYIIKALRSTTHNYNEVLEYLHKNFSFDVVCNKWIKLLDEVENNIPPSPIHLKIKDKSLWHYLRHVNKRLKTIIPYGYSFLPSCMFYEAVINKIKNTILCNH